MQDCDVVIVGGGPVGLFLAAELGQRGIRVELFDAKPGTSVHPAANANSARTMEHFRRIGIASTVRTLGLPPDYSPDIAYFTSLAGHELARLSQPASGKAVDSARAHSFTWPTPEPPHRCSQIFIEPVLLAAAREQSTCNVHFSTTVTAVAQDSDGVTVAVSHEATAANEASVRTLRTRYLVGCDGPRSFVRKTLNVSYGGVSGEQREFMGGKMDAVYFYAPDLYLVGGRAPAWQYWTFGPTQRSLIIAVDGKGHFIMNVQLREEETPGLDTIKRRLFEAIGTEIPFEVKSTSAWTAGYALVAEKFSVGRVFLAGDAAHLFTPTGGLGYNTGIEDAANLAWKLESMVKGRAGDGLADSYHEERQPAAFRNTAFARNFADSIGHLRMPDEAYANSSVGSAVRSSVGEYLAFHARYEFVIPGVHLGARYEHSHLVAGEAGIANADNPNLHVPSARPGNRAPHAWLSDGSSLYDHFGQGFTLLCTDDTEVPPTVLEGTSRVLGQLTISRVTEKKVAELYQCRFALIRPDHHVAWRGSALDDHFSSAILRAIGHFPAQNVAPNSQNATAI
ncbi:MAG: FAD-dependent oxidoreductase [Burkholderiaceae bacterium]